jgi:hypothetical protein
MDGFQILSLANCKAKFLAILRVWSGRFQDCVLKSIKKMQVNNLEHIHKFEKGSAQVCKRINADFFQAINSIYGSKRIFNFMH